jgi:Ca-activated chloride channel family protein
VEQQVEYLSTEGIPASVGLIVDVSLSMQSFGAYARQEALTFLQSLNEESEYFLILFADKPRVEIDLTKDISKVQNIPFIPYQCCTALYDAVYLGMEKIKKASYPKRALVVVTDGADNHSRFTSSNLKDFAREQNVQIFSIGAEGSINNVVDVTGGYAYRGSTRPFMGLDEAYRTIAVELKNEYVIGYRSTNTAKDGRWRQIRLKVDAPRGLSDVTVRAKRGYYAAAK